jgi:predicted RNA-binding protein YlxR (DUF448 family)
MRVAGQDELCRVAIGLSGEFEVGRNLPGRGAWICAGSLPCLDRALRKGGLARALRTTFDEGAGERLAMHLLRSASESP